MTLEVKRKWLIGGGIAAAFLIVLVTVAWQVKSIDIPFVGEGGSAAQADVLGHSDVGDKSMPGLDLQHCVDLWNGSGNARGMNSLSVLTPSYVSVTFSDLYADRCLVTAANPQLNLSAQFLEASPGSIYTYDQVASGEASTLPASVTEWNASSDSEGFLSLNP